MAWSALTTRLAMTWLIWPASISAGARSTPNSNSLRFRLAALGFVTLPRGDVTENEDDARDFIFAVANRGRQLFDDALNAVPRSQGDIFGKIEQNRLRLAAITALLCFGLRGQIDSHI